MNPAFAFVAILAVAVHLPLLTSQADTTTSSTTSTSTSTSTSTTTTTPTTTSTTTTTPTTTTTSTTTTMTSPTTRSTASTKVPCTDSDSSSICQSRISNDPTYCNGSQAVMARGSCCQACAFYLGFTTQVQNWQKLSNGSYAWVPQNIVDLSKAGTWNAIPTANVPVPGMPVGMSADSYCAARLKAIGGSIAVFCAKPTTRLVCAKTCESVNNGK